MDPLSQAIALLKPQAVAWRILECHDAWALRFPTADVAVFGQVVEGRCEAELADATVLDLEPGDFLLLFRPKSWVARTSRQTEPVDFKTAIGDPGSLLSGAGEPQIFRFMAGAFVFGAPDADLLASLMPPLVHVRAAEVAANPLGALLRLLGDEALADRPGRSLVLDRLLEIMLVEALRREPGGLEGSRRGLLAGLADVRIGAALQLMHADVQRAWTVVELARNVGMSRSAFAARFARTVGSPPIDYLSNWRMTLAKSALTSSKAPMSDVAELAGYASVSAFSTAFSRSVGCSPSRYARSAHSPPYADPRQAPS